MKPIPLNNPKVQTLISELVAQTQNVSERHLLPGRSQSEDGTLFSVPKCTQYGYQPNQCWHNCRIHELTNIGQVIYGWSLYHGEYAGDMCSIAQHHAIWKDANGNYLDVTPETNLEHITFYADSRLKIGHEQTIWTPPLFYLNTNGHLWLAGLDSNSRMSKSYFETKMKSLPFAIQALGLLPP